MIQIKNETKGLLSLPLEDSTGVKPTKIFRMQGEQIIPIPDDYAASIYNNEGIKKTLEMGYFSIIKGKEEVIEKAVEEGLTTKEEIKAIEGKVVPNSVLLATLKSGTPEKLKEYLKSPNRDRLIMLAQDNVEIITKEKIKIIEDMAGIGLSVDE